MEDKTKFYIFDKKEIALIFAFMLLVALVAFVLGVKFGLGYSYDSSGLTPEDRQQVDLLSTKEEQVNKLLEKKQLQPQDDMQNIEEMRDHSVKKLKEEFEKLDEQPATLDIEPEEETQADVEQNSVTNGLTAQNKVDPYKGNLTIRLASFRSLEDAKEFAGGFKGRGYNTIISDKNLAEKGGVWYRVSIGAFDKVWMAKKYIKENQSLFATQDFRILPFD